MPPLRVLVDGRVMRDSYHGIGRHIFALLHELGKRDLELTVIVPDERGRLDTGSLLEYPAISLVRSSVPVVSLRSQLELRRHIARAQPDVLFVPYHLSTPLKHRGAPVLSIVHDCIFERRAEQPGHGSLFLSGYRFATRWALKSADVIATVSEATRSDLKHFYGVELSPDTVVPHGVSREFFASAGSERPAGLDLPQRYVLHVGARRPHKNQQLLVRALANWAPTYPELGLVLVGARDPHYGDTVGQLITELGVSRSVRRFEHVSEPELLALYGNAAVFAYPSLAEGFGLPLLEAMAADVPVVASDAEAVQEATEGAALVLPPDDPDLWAKRITEVAYDTELADRMRRNGRSVAEEHSWAGSADRTLRLLSVAAGRQHSKEQRG